ncbi:hypothetical protein [Sphingomonas sp.]|uniref:hypothetical protein n=1 Tax=Sphingomonas sp. TaxID=28214 RepID=UPI002DD6871C|nr:hypothetical protein [Sphingomonas sp.]
MIRAVRRAGRIVAHSLHLAPECGAVRWFGVANAQRRDSVIDWGADGTTVGMETLSIKAITGGTS